MQLATKQAEYWVYWPNVLMIFEPSPKTPNIICIIKVKKEKLGGQQKDKDKV